MKSESRIRSQSGLLIRWPVLITFLIGGAAAAWAELDSLSAVLLVLAFAGTAIRLWGQLAVRKVSVSVTAEPAAVFPGQKVKLNFEIRNDKLLPLVWLELTLPLPDPVPLMPEEKDEVRPLNEVELQQFIVPQQEDLVKLPPTHTLADEKRFSLIGGYTTVSFDTQWNAERRGVFRLTDAGMATGDGLGLGQHELPLRLNHTDTVTVYPRPVPVDISLFMKDMSCTENSALGTWEDVTIIKSTRDYLPTDPARRINWRLAAHGQPLQLNVFETVLPYCTLLIFDGDSFNGPEPDTEGLETCISIVTGLVLALDERGVRCCLSVPKTEEMPEAVLYETSDMLHWLAGYRLRPCALMDFNGKRMPYARRPRFQLQATLEEAAKSGKAYYICRDASGVSNRLTNRLDSIVFLSMIQPGKCPEGMNVMPLTGLIGGESRG